MAVSGVNGAQTDVTIVRKYHKKGTNTFYLYDAEGNRYTVGQRLYDSTKPGSSVNSSQLPFNRKVTFQTPVATNPTAVTENLQRAQQQLATMQQQYTGNTYYDYLMNRINGGQPATPFTPPFTAPAEEKAIAQWNGKITYKGVEYPNLAEFRRFNPEAQIQPLTPVSSVPPVKQQPTAESPSLAGRSAKDIQAQQRALYYTEQGTPKVTMQKIKEGPHKGKYGVFVNGKLQENQIFGSRNAASKARIALEKTLSDPAKRAAMTEADAMEALVREQAQAITPEQRANLFAERQLAQTEADATQAWLREQAQIPQVVRDEAAIAAEEARLAATEGSLTPEPILPHPGETPAAPKTPVNPITPEAPKPFTTAADAVEAGTKNIYPAANGKVYAKALEDGVSIESAAKTLGEDAGKAAVKAETKGLSKAGKWGLAIAGIALVGTALFGLSKCEGEKQQLPPVTPEKPEEPEQPVQPEEQQEQPVVPQNEEIEAVKGSHEWGYSELELLAEHQGQADYKPSNAEILERTFQMLEREGRKLADDGIHSDPMLLIGDKIPVSPELAKVINEATAELKEAHKDNPNYKVTWTELKAKVKEKLAV